MKHKKIYLTLTILVSLLFLSFISPTLAWFNAPSNTSGNKRNCARFAVNAGRDPVDVYWEHFRIIDDPYKQFYSTHDYIAHFAIEYLNKYDFTGKYSWLLDPTKRYFYIFLLATEYPDYSSSAPRITLDCGKSKQVSYDFGKSTSHTLGLSIGSSERHELKVYEALNKKDKDNNLKPWYETAAFYLGAISHYGGEFAHPVHASGIGTVTFHTWLEREVSKVTTLDDFQDNGFFGLNFFTIDLENILGWSPFIDGFKSYNPKQALSNLALVSTLNIETYFGNENNGSQGAHSLYYFYSQTRVAGKGFDFVNDVGRDGSKLSPSFSHLKDKYIQFLDRIEVLLNYAVYFTACLIKYILRNFNGQVISCNYDDEDDERNPRPSDDQRNPPFDSLDLIVRYGAIIAAFIAVGLIGRKSMNGIFR